MPRLPRLAILLSLAGLLPFLALGFAAVMPDPHGRAMTALLGYGAVILSFIGAVHWGFALVSPAPLPGATKSATNFARAEQARLVGGTSASLLGWAALLAAMFSPALSLAILIAGFLTLVIVEQRAVPFGWMPRHYMILRWVLSPVVCLTLLAVLVLRLLAGPR